MTKLDSILKSRDITLPTKVCLVKGVVFPVVLYGCESWSIKKAECQWVDAFELWCWRRLLRVPWTARRSNLSLLKEISSWIFIGRTDAEALILWPLHAKNWLIGKDPDAGKIEGRRRVRQMRWLDDITNSMDMSLSKLRGVGDGQGSLVCCSNGVAKSWTGPRDWTDTFSPFLPFLLSAAAAKSLQLCPTLCDPIRLQPTRFSRPWDSPGKNTGMGCHCLLQCKKNEKWSWRCSVMSDS